MRDERGKRKQLPDLAVWRRGAELPVALVAEEGHRCEDRQRLILEGWRDAVLSGRYIAVQYDCASAPVAARMARLAKMVHFTRPEFTATVQARADEIAAIAQATEIEEPARAPRATSDSPNGGSADELDGRQLQPVPPPAPSTAITPARRARRVAQGSRRARAPIPGDHGDPRPEATAAVETVRRNRGSGRGAGRSPPCLRRPLLSRRHRHRSDQLSLPDGAKSSSLAESAASATNQQSRPRPGGGGWRSNSAAMWSA